MRPYSFIRNIFSGSIFAFALLQSHLHLSYWLLTGIIFSYINLLVLGAIYIRWNFYLRSYNNAANTKNISLTFDDGPTEETAAILDILKTQNVSAAFFLIGKNVIANPGMATRLHNEGHLLGNHSFNHGFNFDWQSTKKMTAELVATNEAIQSVTGTKPLFIRPPYGVTNPNLAKAITALGLSSIGWSVRSFDTKAKNAAQLLNKILNSLKGGDIILLHDKVPLTKEILTDLIVKARQKGFTFVRVDQLLDISAYA